MSRRNSFRNEFKDLRRAQPLGDLSPDGDRLIDFNRALSDAIGERRAFDQLEDQKLSRWRIRDQGLVGNVIQRANVGMAELRDERCLAR